MSREAKYIIRVLSAPDDHPDHDNEFWSVIYEDRWVGGSARPVSGTDMYDTDVMVFETRASAENYKNKWDPDPYYINPKEYEIVPVTPKYKKEVAGYERRR
jgi:hypothetical protein